MNSSKEVAVRQGNTELEQVVAKPISLTKTEAVVAFVPVAAPSTFILVVSGIFSLVNNDPTAFLTAAPVVTGFMTIAGTGLFYFDKIAKIDRAFSPEDTTNIPFKLRMKARKERVLINTIHIKEKVDVAIDSWQDPKNAVEEHEATHTIKQYLRKTKKGFQVEQEISPNNESIWDISADALVEVYGVQEKTEFQREVTA